MPRIFKGTETLLKLFVPRVDEGNLETLKIGLFTDDTNNAAEFYGDNMSIDGDTVYLKVNAWSFDMMNDGVINYIAEIEIGDETIITERQSNYFLKTPNQYVPVGPDLSDYYTKEEVDAKDDSLHGKITFVDNKLTTNYIPTEDLFNYLESEYVDKITNTENYTELDGKITTNKGYIDEIKDNKWAIISGDKNVASNYGNTQYAYLKTINGESLIGEGDISVAGGSGGDSVVFEVEGTAPTIEQFNEAMTLFQQGKRVVFKQGEMVCTVIGASDKYIQVLYGDTFTTYIDTMFIMGGQVNGFKAKKKTTYNGKPFDEVYIMYNFPNLPMYGEPNNTKGLTHAIQYKDWYISATVNPDTLDVSCVLGDKLYVWNYANGEKDEKGHTIPRITDLATQGGSSEGGSDECIIIYEPNEETYTDVEKAHNAEMIKKIHEGTVKTAYLRYRNHYYDNAYIYVPLGFGWEVAGEYGYMTGVCKYWYYGSLHYDYFAIDMDESGYAYKFEVAPIETGTGGSGDADLSNYYTKEEVDELISNSGGGSTPSTETDSGVYVLEFVDDIHEYLQDGGVRDKLYEGSDRQTHNASVYQAWLEGKVKAIYYKQLSNTWYNEWEGAQYKLIPCMVNDTYYWDSDINVRCMTVSALYRNSSDYNPTDIYSLSFPMKEDGRIIRDYYVSDYWMYSSEIGIGGVSNNGEGFQLDKVFASQLYNEQYKVGLLNVYDNTGEVPTQERILAKLMVDGDFWGGDATLTVYGTLSNGSLIKWEFQVYSGEILNEIAIAQIIPMEVDLSSYYTKEEVDGLIANINLGDGATIENIVANEVANQLTDNFKTINGESILGEGDITIEGNADLSNYYTKEETNNLIANSGGGSGNIGELFYPTITSPTIVGEMTFGDEQLPHEDISASVYCNFKARKTQSKDLWVNNIHIGTNTDTVKIASPYYESTENMPDGEQEVYAEFTTEGIKEMGQYLSDKYVLKSEISSTIQRLSGESLNGEEVYNLWQNNIPIWMDYHGYDRDNGDIYTAYAPLHIYKPLANGTELRVYMWITPNIYVEWQLEINNNDDVHGVITVKE